MKKVLSFILAMVLVVTVAGCGDTGSTSSQMENSSSGVSELSSSPKSSATVSEDVSSSSGETQGEYHTVVDHAGNEVEVPYDIQRIVVADIYPLPSVLSVFFDSAEKIVGMAPASMTAAQNSLLSELYPEILNAETSFTDGTTINIEELVKLDPDVVFYGASNPEIGEQLKNSGIPGIAISVNKWDYNAIETLDNWISLISELFPDNDKTELVSNYSNQVYDEIQQRVADMSDEERARVFFLFQYSDTTIATSGQHFFGQWWADAIGAVNVAQELTTDNANQVSMEQIYGWNPDTILITNFNQATPDDLYNNAIGSYDWSEIDAIKLKQVYKMPLGMYRSYTPGVDTPVTLYWLAKTVYPDLFEDIDVTEKTIDYYDSVFGIQLTEEQAESIFTPVTAAGEVYFD